MSKPRRSYLVAARQWVLGGAALRRFALRTYATYWRFRRVAARVDFTARKVRYRGREAVAERSKRTSLAFQLIRAVASAAVFAVLLLAAIEALELLLLRVPVVAEFLVRHRPSPATYSSAMTAIAQIEGVFLGLYFTALSVVVSTTYRDVDPTLRSELLNEQVGSIYVRLLALTASGALVLLWAISVGQVAGVLSFSVFLGLAILSVLGFLPLGRRVFAFFDPHALSSALAQRIITSADSATPKGVSWADPSFQASYQRQAEHAVRTFRTISEVSGSGGPSSSLLSHGRLCLFVMDQYSQTKRHIPHVSLWYRRRYRHGSWLTADHSQLELALATSTLIQPQEEADYIWLERELIEIVESIIGTLYDRADFEGLSSLFDAMSDTARTMATRLQFEETSLLHERTLSVCRKLRMSSPTLDVPAANLALRSATYGSRGMIAAVAVGFGESCRRLVINDVITRLERAARRPAPASLDIDVPRSVVTSLSHLRERLLFERQVERKEITPTWYVHDYLGAHLATSLASFAANVLLMLARSFEDDTAELESPAIALTVVQIGLETCNKLEHHLASVRAATQAVTDLRWKFSEQRWPTQHPASWLEQVAAVRSRLLGRLAALAPSLPTDAPSGELPDDFGYAVTTLSQSCFEALLKGDSDLFTRIFPAYFMTGLMAADRVRQELREHTQSTQLTIWSDLIIDVLEISGYALVFHELDGLPVVDQVMGTWRRYAATQTDPRRASELVSTVADYRRSAFSLSAHSIIRTSWGQAFARQMRERGMLTESLFSYGRDAPIQPISPIARAFIASCDVGTRAADFFEAMMHERLFGRPPETSAAVESCRRSVMREFDVSGLEPGEYLERIMPEPGRAAGSAPSSQAEPEGDNGR